MRKRCRIRVILISKCPGIRQFSAGDNRPADHIRHSVSALLSRLRYQEQSPDLREFIQKRQIYHAPGIQDNNYLLIHSAQFSEHLMLVAAHEIIASLRCPVYIFSGAAAQDIDRGVCIRSIYLRPSRDLERRCRICHPEIHTFS